MRRFYLPDIDPAAEKAILLGTEHHHARNVLRLAVGDEVSVLDGRGREFVCRIASMEKNESVLQIVEETRAAAPESPLAFTLAAAAVPGEKYDLIVQKAVELGVTTFVPLSSSRCEMKLKEIAKKIERWRRIALDASKQCGRAKLMEIREPRNVIDLIQAADDGLRIFFSERDGGSIPVRSGIKNLTAVIGPKGGWDSAELDAAKNSDLTIVTLGGRILRAETAAISLTAILQHRFGDLN